MELNFILILEFCLWMPAILRDVQQLLEAAVLVDDDFHAIQEKKLYYYYCKCSFYAQLYHPALFVAVPFGDVQQLLLLQMRMLSANVFQPVLKKYK